MREAIQSRVERGRKESNLGSIVFNGLEDSLEGVVATTALDSSCLVVFKAVIKSFRAVVIRETKWFMQAFQGTIAS